MKPLPISLQSETQPPSCGCGSTCHAPGASATDDTLRADSVREGLLLHIPAMDCPAEESEIRRAVEHVEAIGGLRFDLSARTLRIDAPEDALPTIIDAIRKAGFATELVKPGTPVGKDRDGIPRGIAVLAMALALALGAELLAYLMPQVLLAKMAGMGLAATAIVMAGFSTYSKGLAALSQGRLNINALMSVAVTGAFLIGQWPEAAMVMALYVAAERIEDGAMDRARMRTLAFTNPLARAQLEAIVHPWVTRLGDQQARDAATAGHRAIVFDIPLLVESGRWVRKLDAVVVVDCSTETQIHRVMARNGLQRAAVQAILDTQASRPARRAAADAVVVNDGIALNTLHGHAVQLARLFGL